MKKVWLYSIASFLSAAVLLTGQILGGNANAPLMGEGLGLIVVLVSCQICFHLNRVDELLVDSKPRVFIQKVLKSAGAGLVLAAILSYIVPRMPPGFAAAAVSAFLVLFGLAVLRPLAPPFAQKQGAEETLVIGSGVVARKLYEELTVHDAMDDVRLVQYSDLPGFSGRTGISRIVVADCVLHNDEDATHALLDFKLRGVRIESAATSFERTGRRIWLEGLSLERLIFAEGFCPSRIYLACKRLADALLSAVLLAVTAPLMGVIAIAIKLETPGPAIFSQERVGFLGKKFTVYKFRSMLQDAERDTGPIWAKEDDERVTRIGWLLRKWRLDELPQAWNVLCGDMSFIGPRPERPYFVELLKNEIPYYDLRHYAKPGITGWAQVMYRYGASIEDSRQKLQYDLYYAKNVSLALDLLILFKTIKVVIAGEGR